MVYSTPSQDSKPADGWLGCPYPLKEKRVWVAGHNGLAGAAVTKALQRRGSTVLTVPKSRLDLRDQRHTEAWVMREKPDVIVLTAAKVGGIAANAEHCADFIYDNLMIESNILHAAFKAGTEKLIFLGSSCVYPKDASQPIREDALMTGPLEPSNESYALAKIAGIKLCQSYRKQYGCDFITAMPCNLYGPGDRFDPFYSHVIPALMLKAHRAKLAGADAVDIWGTGKPLREFLYADDLAEAVCFLLEHYSEQCPVNIGSGEEISIQALAEKICTVTGFQGRLVFNNARPDGTQRKFLDSSRINAAGWKPRMSLDEGLQETYRWFCEHIPKKANTHELAA